MQAQNEHRAKMCALEKCVASQDNVIKCQAEKLKEQEVLFSAQGEKLKETETRYLCHHPANSIIPVLYISTFII